MATLVYQEKKKDMDISHNITCAPTPLKSLLIILHVHWEGSVGGS